MGHSPSTNLLVRSALAVAALSCLPRSAPAQIACQPHRNLTSLAHFDLNTRPEDLAVTPNGKIAIVRGNFEGDRVAAFDLVNATRVTITGTFNGQGVHAHDCDVVEVTNTRAITIGSSVVGGTNENRTHVDIFTLTSSPVTVTVLQSYTLTDGGQVNDVAITPDGSKAVVTLRNRIYVFDLVAPGATPLASINATGAPRWAFVDGLNRDWTDIPADSVALTNDVALVQYGTTQFPCGLRPEPTVFIVDLTANPPALAFTDTIAADLVGMDGCDSRWPHDLAISPDGTLGVAGGNLSLALYDLVSFTRLDLLPGSVAQVGGLYQTISQTTAGFPFVNYGTGVDSVALTNTRLITVADESGVQVYDISGGTLAQVLSIVDHGVHDVAVLNNGTTAVAHSRATTYVIDLTVTPPTFVAVADAAGSDPRGSTNAFVSDSIVMSQTPDRCVSLTTNSTTRIGSVRILDTSSGSIVASQSVSFDDSSDRLVDLRAIANFVFVRGSNGTGGSDFFGINTCTGQSMGSFDLSGECRGVDHLEASSTRVITTSENPSGAGGIRGFVDIFSF